MCAVFFLFVSTALLFDRGRVQRFMQFEQKPIKKDEKNRSVSVSGACPYRRSSRRDLRT